MIQNIHEIQNEGYVQNVLRAGEKKEDIKEAISGLHIEDIERVAESLVETDPEKVLLINEITNSPERLKNAVERAHTAISRKQSVA